MDLQNHLLIANDPHCPASVSRTLIYICQHNAQGTMGLIVNQTSGLELQDILQSLSINIRNRTLAKNPVLVGGPVEANSGFVLHTQEQGESWYSSLMMNNGLCITTSKDIMHALARNQGPKEAIVTLGYSGWAAGQLEQEITERRWLTCYANPTIIFRTPVHQRWAAAQRLLGIAPYQFCGVVGHA